MKKTVSDVAIALGMTSISLIWLVSPLIQSDHNALTHWSGDPRRLFLPPILDFILVWLLLTLLLLSARSSSRFRVLVWLSLVLFLPSIAVKSCLLYFARSSNHLDLVLAISALLVITLVISWRRSLDAILERIVEFYSTILAFVGVSGALLLVYICWLGWQARGVNQLPFVGHHQNASSVAVAKPKIIWVVLDELSYEQIYGHRFPGLNLPAFDLLAKEAVVLSNVIPAENYTEKVLPTLLTGKSVDRVRSTPDGKLMLHDPASKEWQAFDQHDTIFQDALSAGYSTGIAGWYNPYCRMMPAVLDHCFWTYRPSIQNRMSSGVSLPANMLAPLKRAFPTRFLPLFLQEQPRSEIMGDPSLQIADAQELVSAADALVEDPSVTFMLLHLPFPHPTGIYKRRTGQLTTRPSTYIDNLALADKYVAHLRLLLQERKQWDTSTVIIMGDHSWRTFLWKPDGWTEEEEKASQGATYDPRPAYMVKLAHVAQGARVGSAFPASHTRKLLDALVTGQIETPSELTKWIEQESQPTEMPNKGNYILDAHGISGASLCQR